MRTVLWCEHYLFIVVKYLAMKYNIFDSKNLSMVTDTILLQAVSTKLFSLSLHLF